MKLALQILIVPVVLFTALVLYSLALNLNFFSAISFWFILVPIIAFAAPYVITKNKPNLPVSITGLILFYAFMVFMIYDHYQTDLFKVMIFSLPVSLGLLLTALWVKLLKSMFN